MPDTNSLKDGDFAAHLDGLANRRHNASPESGMQVMHQPSLEEKPEPQTIQQVLEGEEPTDEFLEEMRALQDAPELSDEEFERQALAAPGDDGDIQTPE